MLKIKLPKFYEIGTSGMFLSLDSVDSEVGQDINGRKEIQ